MSEYDSNSTVDYDTASSTEYWAESGSSVTTTLSPASDDSGERNMPDETPAEDWGSIYMGTQPATEEQVPYVEILRDEFMQYVERFLLLNLFMLSPATLWNLYIQLHIFYSMCSTPVFTNREGNPQMENDVEHDVESEPPILAREQ